MNRAVLAGRLVVDPEAKDVGDLNITRIRLAVDEYIKGEKQAFYFDVTAFGGTAKACASTLTKGSFIAVDGRIRTRTYEAKDGSGTRYATEIVADRIDFGSPPAQPGEQAPKTAGKSVADEDGPAW